MSRVGDAIRLMSVLALSALYLNPGSVEAQAIAITGAEVHTGSGDMLTDATVLILDGRIAAVGRDVTIPDGARRIDATGKVVTPGFFDAFTGLGTVEIGAEANTNDRGLSNEHVTAAFDVRDGVNPRAINIETTRVEGITRAVIVPQSQALIQGQGVVANLGGSTMEDMIDRSPAAMYAVMGEAGAAIAGGSRGAASLLLREALDDAVDYARNREAYNAGRRRAYALSRLDLEALLPVVRGDIPLVVQANRASDIRAAMRLSQEYDLGLVVAGALEGWMVADELAANGVPVIVNTMINLPTFESLGATYENAARLRRAGVTVMLSSFDTHNVRNLRQIAGFAVSHGMPHEAAIEAVTGVPARVFGVGNETGILEAGKAADVVIWSGDPFELTTWAETVFISGREVSRETRQKALFDRYRDLSRLPPRR